MIYLDNAATTYPKPNNVYDVMDQFYRSNGVNAGRGIYQAGLEATNIIEETRKRLHHLFQLGGNKEVVFSSSATQAINTIIKGLDYKQGDNIYYSPFEHNAVLRSLYYLEEKFNVNLIQLPVDANTLEFNLDELEMSFVKSPPNLVAVSHVSNVCGVIAPIEEIAILTHRYKGIVLVDGAQAAILVTADFEHIDYYVWTAHKSLYGPFGIAGFIIDNDSPAPTPLLHGGTGSVSELRTMPDHIPTKYEAGSLNIHAIAGLNAALQWLEQENPAQIFAHEKKLTHQLINVLEDFIDVHIFKPEDMSKHFTVVSASFSGYRPDDIGKILSERYDIAVRTGLHCAPEIHRILGTMPTGLVRFSIGYFNTQADLERLRESLETFIV